MTKIILSPNPSRLGPPLQWDPGLIEREGWQVFSKSSFFWFSRFFDHLTFSNRSETSKKRFPVKFYVCMVGAGVKKYVFHRKIMIICQNPTKIQIWGGELYCKRQCKLNGISPYFGGFFAIEKKFFSILFFYYIDPKFPKDSKNHT